MNLVSETPADTIPATLHCDALCRSERENAAQHDVGLLARNLTAIEVDLHIQDLGRLAEKALADGDPTGARLWADRMYAAIAARTPQHQAAMEAEILRQIDDGAGYFAAQGELDRRRLVAETERKAAA